MTARLRQQQLVPVLALSLATALWGSTFVLSKDLVTRHDPISIQAIRFVIAGLAMWAIRPRCLQAVSVGTWKRAIALGALYGAAQAPQYLGLRETTAATAGVITGTYVAFVPVLSFLILRRRSGTAANIGVALAVLGLAVVAADGFHLGRGELLVLVAAAIYGGQVVAMGLWSLPGQAWTLTTIQMLTIGVVLGVPATVRGWDLPTGATDWMLIGYLSLVASALTVGLQTWSQARLTAVRAAVILAAEPIWAAGLAVGLSDETMSYRLLLGACILVIASGVVLSSREPAPPTPRPERPRRRGRSRTSATPTRESLRQYRGRSARRVSRTPGP